MSFKLKNIVAATALVFSPVTLADNLLEIYNKALENDPTLRAAEATFKANSEQRIIARSALLPQIKAEASYGTSESEDDAGITTAKNNYGWEVSLQQTVFNASTWFDFKAADLADQRYQAEFASDQQELIIRTAEAYFSVLKAIANLETSRAEEAALQRQFEQSEQKFEVGLIAITDVHEARASLDNVIASRIQLEGQVGIAFEQLEALTGQPEASIAPLTEEFPITQPSPTKSAPWVQKAMEENFDVKQARFAMHAAEKSSKSASWMHGPTVTLAAKVGDSTSDQEEPTDLPKAGTESWGVTLSASLPLYSGGRISAQSRQAAEQFNVAKENYIGAQRNITQQARSAYLNAMTGVATVEARKQAIISSESSLDATQAGYEVGTRNIVDVLNTQQALFRSKANYSNARFDYIIAMLKLKQVAGSLTPQDIIDLNKWLSTGEQLERLKVTGY